MFARFMTGSLAASFLVFSTNFSSAQGSGLSPAEPPPASHTANRYVDSRGCVFLRSTFAGQVSWVPLFGADAKPVCDGGAAVAQPVRSVPEAPAAHPPAPAEEPAQVAATDAEPATDVEPVDERIVVVAPQVQEPASTPQPAATPRRTAARTTARPPSPPAATPHRDCPEGVPYGQLVRAADGRLLVRCVSEPDRLLVRTGRNIPLDPDAPEAERAEATPAPVPEATETAAAAPPVTPVAAPARTAATPDAVPMPGRYVQVASFAVPDNARRTRAALGARDIPVQSQAARMRGRPLEVILIGPFADDAELRRALGTVRAMGFRDAFVRG